MDNKTVMITGATDGLGKFLANDFAEKGASVLMHGRNREKGQTAVQEIKEQPEMITLATTTPISLHWKRSGSWRNR